MKFKQIFITAIAAVSLVLSIAVIAGDHHPYHNGSVWEVSFIRVLPGSWDSYMTYLSSDWKKAQEALKAAGIIMSYKVISTEGHSASDWNLMLMVEYKDMASMEANEDKAEEVMNKIFGESSKQDQSMKDRGAMRELGGQRLGREILLHGK